MEIRNVGGRIQFSRPSQKDMNEPPISVGVLAHLSDGVIRGHAIEPLREGIQGLAGRHPDRFRASVFCYRGTSRVEALCAEKYSWLCSWGDQTAVRTSPEESLNNFLASFDDSGRLNLGIIVGHGNGKEIGDLSIRRIAEAMERNQSMLDFLILCGCYTGNLASLSAFSGKARYALVSQYAFRYPAPLMLDFIHYMVDGRTQQGIDAGKFFSGKSFDRRVTLDDDNLELLKTLVAFRDHDTGTEDTAPFSLIDLTKIVRLEQDWNNLRDRVRTLITEYGSFKPDVSALLGKAVWNAAAFPVLMEGEEARRTSVYGDLGRILDNLFRFSAEENIHGSVTAMQALLKKAVIAKGDLSGLSVDITDFIPRSDICNVWDFSRKSDIPENRCPIRLPFDQFVQKCT